MENSEVLNGAGDHIQRFGLAKNRLHGEGDPKTSPACSLGAIIVASGGAGCGDFLKFPEARSAAVAFNRHIGYEINIASWNNTPGRTTEDVVAAFRAAAAVEELKEATLRGMPTPDDEPVVFVPAQRPSPEQVGAK